MSRRTEGALLAGLTLSPTLSACGDRCRERQGWEDVPVILEDPSDEAMVEVGQTASEALGWFMGWSGEDQVCVAQIEVVRKEGWEEVEGDYRFPSGRIRISADTEAPWTATWHELCHAVDADLDVSLDHPDLFDPSTIDHHLVYRSRRSRTREAFARSCDDGPRDTVLPRIWEESCGIPPRFDLERAEAVRRAVYPRAPPLPWAAPSLELTLGHPWKVADPGEGWFADDLARSGDSLVILTMDSALTAARLQFVDPVTGQGGDPIEVPNTPPEGALYSRMSLIPGDESAWLDTADGQTRALWRLSGGRVTRVTHPCPGETGARVVDGVLWLEPQEETDPLEVEGCVLETGERVRAPLLALEGLGTGSGGVPTHPQVREVGGRLALWWTGAGLTWLDDDGVWQRHLFPQPLGVALAEPGPSGEWLLALTEVHKTEDGYAFYSVLVGLDPLTGAYFTPTDPCPLDLDPGMFASDRMVVGDGWAALVRGANLYDDSTRIYPVTLGP